MTWKTSKPEPEEAGEATKNSGFGGTYGESLTPPSRYYCAVCKGHVLAQHVAWDDQDRPHCPVCDTLLQKKAG